MKIVSCNSTLSCILKCIGFLTTMISKKRILGFLFLFILGSCATPTAMLGPAYTLSSTGNVFQAGLTYGSNEAITIYTGKTPLENLQEINPIEKNNKNIRKKTLESEDFYILVKQKIETTGNKLKLTNQ